MATAKKSAGAKSAAKKAAGKKAAGKKAVAKRATPAKKPATLKKTASKKAANKKTANKKAAAKKTASKKPVSKKTASTKTAGKRARPGRPPGKKSLVAHRQQKPLPAICREESCRKGSSRSEIRPPRRAGRCRRTARDGSADSCASAAPAKRSPTPNRPSQSDWQRPGVKVPKFPPIPTPVARSTAG